MNRGCTMPSLANDMSGETLSCRSSDLAPAPRPSILLFAALSLAILEVLSDGCRSLWLYIVGQDFAVTCAWHHNCPVRGWHHNCAQRATAICCAYAEFIDRRALTHTTVALAETAFATIRKNPDQNKIAVYKYKKRKRMYMRSVAKKIGHHGETRPELIYLAAAAVLTSSYASAWKRWARPDGSSESDHLGIHLWTPSRRPWVPLCMPKRSSKIVR